MSRWKKVVLIILLCLFGITSSIILMAIDLKYGWAPKDTRDEFLTYLEYYNTMAEIYYEDYQKYDENQIVYFPPESDAIYCRSYGYDGHKIELSSDEAVSCQRACRHYEDLMNGRNLERVYVYDTFVSFSRVDGNKSLVYSVDGKRPSYINRPGDGRKHITVEKLTDHWYYVYDLEYLWG